VLHNIGTVYIFEQRAARLQIRLKLITFTGLVVPLIIGALVASFGTHFAGLAAVLIVGGFVVIAQLVLSLWSLVAGWVSGYEQSIRSVVANLDLKQAFDSLAKNSTATTQELQSQLDVLKALDGSRRQIDHTGNAPSAAELRMGMRSALRELAKSCVKCNEIPYDMTPTECEVCGAFKSSRYRAPRLP
jgi:mobilome CxxCx(11)CxxC protein